MVDHSRKKSYAQAIQTPRIFYNARASGNSAHRSHSNFHGSSVLANSNQRANSLPRGSNNFNVQVNDPITAIDRTSNAGRHGRTGRAPATMLQTTSA